MVLSAATQPSLQQFAARKWGAQQAACAIRHSQIEPQDQFLAADPTNTRFPCVLMDGRAMLEQMRREREQQVSGESPKAPELKAIVGGRPDFGYSHIGPAPGSTSPATGPSHS